MSRDFDKSDFQKWNTMDDRLGYTANTSPTQITHNHTKYTRVAYDAINGNRMFSSAMDLAFNGPNDGDTIDGHNNRGMNLTLKIIQRHYDGEDTPPAYVECEFTNLFLNQLPVYIICRHCPLVSKMFGYDTNNDTSVHFAIFPQYWIDAKVKISLWKTINDISRGVDTLTGISYASIIRD